MSLVALKCMLTQTDVKSEIQKIGREISRIEKWKLPEQGEVVLYINLKTPYGAALIGHALGDGTLLLLRGKDPRFRYVNIRYSYVEDVAKILRYYGFKCTIREVERGEWEKQFTASIHGPLAYALFRAVPKALGRKTKGNPKVPSEIVKDPGLAPFFIKAMIKDEAHIDPKTKFMSVTLGVDVTERLGERAQEIRALAEKQIREKVEQKGRKLTRKEEKLARKVGMKSVSREVIKLAETVPSNILLDLKEALQTMEIEPIEKGIQRFYVSKAEDITAYWQIQVNKEEVGKIYRRKLLEGTGAKEAAYKGKYKKTKRSVRLVDEEENVWKLPKEFVEKLRGKYEKHQKKKEDKRVPLSEIEKMPDSEEIVEIIYENRSKELEDKKAELTKKGIEATLKSTCIYLRKGKVVSAEWVLEWFEREEGDRNGRD
ncbi:MAG: hypothetical protein QW261_02220 [Candidatus Jordarchaeaceae archaeon]